MPGTFDFNYVLAHLGASLSRAGKLSRRFSGYVVRGYAPYVAAATSIEARVEVLEKNAKLVNERIDYIQNEMDQKFLSQADLLRREEQTRFRDDELIHDKLQAAKTSCLKITAMGGLWLFVGVTLGTVTPEITKIRN